MDSRASGHGISGKHFAQYRIGNRIGTGTSPRVYRAFDEVERRAVTIKFFENDVEDQVDFSQSFSLAMHSIRRLIHPKIVTVYDWGVTDDYVYIVTKVVDGNSVREYVNKGLNLSQVAGYGVQIANALQCAHTNGVVHGDLHPSNLIIPDEESRYILLDGFGVHAIEAARHYSTQHTTRVEKSDTPLVGAPAYMAPELLAPELLAPELDIEGDKINPRSDLYALGCLLYYMLSGNPPFTGSNLLEIMNHQVRDMPRPIRDRNVAVPPGLASIVHKLLAKRPELRFDSAAEVAQLLGPYGESDTSATTRAVSTPARSGFTDSLIVFPPDSDEFQPPMPVTSGVPVPLSSINIFISYSSDDTPFVTRLAADLRQRHAVIWYAEHDARYGDIRELIDRALEQSQWVVAVFSPPALASKWVQREVNSALTMTEEGRMSGVIPIIARPFDRSRLPPLWTNLKFYDATSNYEDALVGICKAIGLAS
jgi:serine/threonine protein kinase